MDEWKHPEMGDSVDGWVVIECLPGHPNNKWIAIMMNAAKRAPYCVATFLENMPWETRSRHDVFPEFRDAVRVFEDRIS